MKKTSNWLKRFLMKHNLPVLVMGGAVIGGHTKLTAQKYVLDWPRLELAFPEIAGMGTYREKWDFIDNKCNKFPELREVANQYRSSEGQPKRVVKNRLVTTEFVDFIVDQLQAETSEFGDFKFHQCGLGTTNENVTDSGIETDTGISPVTGTQTETDHDTYKSVATMTMDATETITEHVIMSQSGAGTCMDRTEIPPLAIVSGNQIEFTFEISFAAGG